MDFDEFIDEYIFDIGYKEYMRILKELRLSCRECREYKECKKFMDKPQYCYYFYPVSKDIMEEIYNLIVIEKNRESYKSEYDEYINYRDKDD